MRLPTKLSRRLRRFARQEDGAMALAMAGLLPLMFFSLTLVEASRVYGVKNQLQATADAAAMASVWELEGEWIMPDSETAVEGRARDFANHNMPADGQLDNVEAGNWNDNRAEDDRFIPHDEPDGTPVNAVQVTTSGEMRLFFAGALRSLGVGAPDSFTPSAEATALLRRDKCYDNGFVAGGNITMRSENEFRSGFCVYGHDGVSMTSSNFFEAGTGVGMSDLAANWTALSDGFHQNEGLEEALFQKDIATPPLGRAQQLITELTDGFGPIPDYITYTAPPSNTLPDNLQPGTMYIYTGTTNITIGALENVAIVSHNALIKIKSNSTLRSVLLASTKSVDISSNVDIGDANYCDPGEGEGASLIISVGAVTDKKEVSVGTGSNISLHGVQIVTEGTMEMNSNLVITGASVQATEHIKFNSHVDVFGCPDESPNVTGGETKVSQLVD